MKKHYDFSKGEKGKFYIPEDTKKIAMSKLINSILTKDKEIVELILSE